MNTQVKEPIHQKVSAASTKQMLSDEEYARIKNLLGYNGMEVDRGKVTLAATLRELDIDVLHPRSVERYKRERHAEATKRVKNSHGWNGLIRWRWTSVGLRTYKKCVPVSALATAARIAEKLPEAKFLVEELRRERRVIDPFLIVSYKGAKYYIAHWDEPSFQG